ncbi:MAG: hypothetical protein ACFCBW_22635 [Candidatus Competibacterales bacterium]
MKYGALWAAGALALVLFGSVSYGQPATEEKIHGTWELSMSISSTEASGQSGEPLPEGMEVEMAIAGEQTYRANGSYSSEAKINFQMRMPDGDMELNILVEEAGEWQLSEDGRELTEVANESTYQPLDEPTKEILTALPEMGSMFEIEEGNTTTYQIIAISDTEMEIQLEEPELRVVLNKQ